MCSYLNSRELVWLLSLPTCHLLVLKQINSVSPRLLGYHTAAFSKQSTLEAVFENMCVLYRFYHFHVNGRCKCSKKLRIQVKKFPCRRGLRSVKNASASIPITLVVLMATGTNMGCSSQLSIFDLLLGLLVCQSTCLPLGQLHIHI